MNDYGIFFNFENEIIRMPINPEEIGYKQSRDSKKYTVLKLGEINVLGDVKLKEIKLELQLPGRWYPFCAVAESELYPPAFYLRRFEKYIASDKPIRFVVTGTAIGLTMLVSIENKDIKEKAGEEGDIYVELELKEWKDYKAKLYTLNKDKQELYLAGGIEKKPVPPEVVAHSGDTLYMLAAKLTGRGEDCYSIAEYNGIIASEPLKEGQKIYIPEILT